MAKHGTTEQVSGTHSYDLESEEPAIVVVSGPEAGRHVAFEGESIVVGRSRGVDLQIDDPGISKRHLRLYRDSSAIWVDDLGSSNGTFVNGERIEEPYELLQGDTIGIGRDTLICLTVGAGGASEEGEQVLAVGRKGNWFRVDDAPPVDLRRRGAMRRIMDALVEAAEASDPQPLDVHDLFEVGWPDQEIHPDSAAQRVYVAVRKLREEGLSGFLVTGDEGYYLSTDMVTLERCDEVAPPE